jgi:hypothetical protein
LKYEKAIAKLKNRIKEKYGEILAFDTVSFKTTYEYQNLLRNNKIVALIIRDFHIVNIEQIDSNYIFTINIDRYEGNKHIDMTCNKNQLNILKEIYPNILRDNYAKSVRKEVYIILKINYLKKIRFKLNINNDEFDESNYSPELEPSDDFYFNCNFIDIYEKPML